jgi:hypothetical protein
MSLKRRWSDLRARRRQRRLDRRSLRTRGGPSPTSTELTVPGATPGSREGVRDGQAARSGQQKERTSGGNDRHRRRCPAWKAKCYSDARPCPDRFPFSSEGAVSRGTISPLETVGYVAEQQSRPLFLFVGRCERVRPASGETSIRREKQRGVKSRDVV